MKQLRGIDAGMIHLEHNRNQFQVGTLLFYDVSTTKNQFVRFKDILATFQHRVGTESLLRKSIQQVPFALDDPYWVDDPDFDIEYHVRHIALPKPGDWRQLCIQVARIHSRPLDLNKPLWEVYVIEGLDNIKGIPKGGFAMYVKLHHAAIDGIAGNELIAAIHDTSPSMAVSADDVTSDKKPVVISGMVDNFTMLSRAWLNGVKTPANFLKLSAKIAPAFLRIRQAKEKGEFKPLPASDYTRFNGRASGHLVMNAAIMSLDDLKAVKNAVEGCTINDVMLAIVSGALSQYLTNKGEPPTNLSAGMPINIRPYIDNITERDANNLVTVSKVSLASHISDPLERLNAIHQAAAETKAYQNAMGTDVMLELSRSLPAMLMNLASRSIHRVLVSDTPMVNTIITNVPGSQQPLYMAGARLAGMCNIGVVLDGMGLFHAVSSYCGTATISFQACRSMMPDPDVYQQCLLRSLEELKAATLSQSKPTRKKVNTTKTRSKAKKKRTRTATA